MVAGGGGGGRRVGGDGGGLKGRLLPPLSFGRRSVSVAMRF